MATRSPETVEGLVRALSRNRPRLKFLTASFRLRREEAEDLLQDLALVALRKLEEIQDLDGWLLGTARNLCLMRVRSRRLREYVHLEEEGELVSAPGQQRVDLFVDLHRALAILPLRYRTVLVLRALGLTYKEIVATTGYPLGLARRYAERGLSICRARLRHTSAPVVF
jgi:RNA polymerase sigma factor (sigma-70 family)